MKNSKIYLALKFRSLSLSILFVLSLVLSPLFVSAQEVPDAVNYVGPRINSARSDGKQELNSSPVFQKTAQVTELEKKIHEIRKSGNNNVQEITRLQNQIDALTGQSVTMQAGFYPGSITEATPEEQLDAVGNSMVLTKSNMKCIATVTEYTGATAGRIWTVAGFTGAGSSLTPDSMRVLYSIDNGTHWVPFANITLGGTDKFNAGDVDVELIEGGTNKYLHIVFGLRASGGVGRWFAAGSSIQITGTFAGSLWAFTWPGDDAAKRYYSPKITSDNTVWPTSPWAYVAVSFDSAGATGRVNTQKFAQLNIPNTVNPVFSYKANKIYWYTETPNTQNLYTDIAFFQRNGVDSLIISYCGVPDSTKAFFSKMSASGSMISPTVAGQFVGLVGGSEPNFAKSGGRLSSNGNNNGSIFFIFKQKSAVADGIKYFRTTNFGDFNTINQSVIWTASSGVSFPDIVGVRNAYTHRLGFFFWGASDSLKYISVNSEGSFLTNSAKMNSVNLTTSYYSPAVGMRFVPGDSCFALYSANGADNVWSAQGCSGIITGITNPETPVSYSLKQNYPNPFNPSTKISFAIPRQGFVTLKIYDILGKEVATLVNEKKEAGEYIVDFNASNLTTGVYFYKLEAGNFSRTMKMLLVK
ncbi:MAG: T9SS type A sorting domain-containing protein [Ignavibacteriae bacterium]|nr:T9SS type A sorting domain-containing protein [Ignavibacteriota bacterium]